MDVTRHDDIILTPLIKGMEFKIMLLLSAQNGFRLTGVPLKCNESVIIVVLVDKEGGGGGLTVYRHAPLRGLVSILSQLGTPK